jgi:hypothetical protein
VRPPLANELDKLVRIFVSKRRPPTAWWTGPERPESLADAIDASFGLRSGDRIHHHQRRVGRRALTAARNKLRRVESKIRKARDFEELHLIVDRETVDVHRFGELSTYDVAQRIGDFLNLSPRYVYLHAGTREGAKAFRGSGNKVKKSFFPRPLWVLSPAEIEDFLCIFADQLRGRSSISSHTWCGRQNLGVLSVEDGGCPPRSRRRPHSRRGC